MTRAFIAILTIVLSSPLAIANELSQIVIPFKQKKDFTSRYDKNTKRIVLYIKNTAPEEVEEFFNYDQTHIKRLLLFSKNENDTEVHIVPQSSRIQSSIYSFDEPFRIVLDFYPADYSPSPSKLEDSYTARPDREGELIGPNSPTRRSLVNRRKEVANDAKTNQADPTTKKRLLQPRPKEFASKSELASVLDKTKSGPGPKWKIYPPYVYRINIAPYLTGANNEEWDSKNLANQSSNALADYAAKLFDFGHENRALIAYQKVLHEKPMLFHQNVGHLWRLAEIHLGRGNLTLANGYYSSLIESAPDHPLAQFSKLRKKDIAAIKALEEGDYEKMPKIYVANDDIYDEKNPELKLQKAIRGAYWEQDLKTLEKINSSNNQLPDIDQDHYRKLESLIGKGENPKTNFLASSLLLNQAIKNSDQWNSELTDFANDYFERYEGSAAEPYRSELLSKTKQLINDKIIGLTKDKQYQKAATLYKTIPKNIDDTDSSYETLWALAKSNQNLSLHQQALKSFDDSAKVAPDPISKFRSLYYAQYNALNALETLGARKDQDKELKKIRSKIKSYDRNLLQLWSKFNDSERARLALELSEVNTESLSRNYPTQIQPDILLWSWSKDRSRVNMASNDNKTIDTAQNDPDELKIRRITQLANRFDQLGITKNKIQAKELLKEIDPSKTNSDQEVTNLWAKELVALAEVYRKNNQYLEAGRIYTLTGDKASNWEGKAEALYKGGLLLFRSGKRTEAIEAFNKAANNGDNLLYAELAKKRLEQLKE